MSPWSPSSPASAGSSPQSSIYSFDSGMPQIKPLAPPPRRRRPRTSGDSIDSLGSTRSRSARSPSLDLAAANPYINPAPTIEQIKELHGDDRSTPGSLQRDLKHSDSGPTRYYSHDTSPLSVTITKTTSTTPATTTTMTKPPIPTSPKPDFSTLRTQSRSRHASHPYSALSSPSLDSLGPTTNHLNSNQRSDLVRKSRKLAQVFGQTPTAGSLAAQGRSFLDLPSSSLAKHRHHRAAHSVSSDINISSGGAGRRRSGSRTNKPSPVWPPPQGTQYVSASGRRHSTPLTPDQFSFLSDNPTDEYDDGRSFYSHRSSELNIEIGSTHEGSMYEDDAAASFIDLSDDDSSKKQVIITTTAVDDASEDAHSLNHRTRAKANSISTSGYHHSELLTGEPDGSKARGKSRANPETSSPDTTFSEDLTSSPTHQRSSSISTDDMSIFENLRLNMSPEEQAEDERRRRREKLAKLHRFLGSRVPPDLVVGGLTDPELPPLAPADALMSLEGRHHQHESSWLKRRRSSSAAAFPSWSDDLDRLRDGLSHEEKAINVKRAQKMEKVFGVAPPQTLFHTRHSPSPSVPPSSLSSAANTISTGAATGAPHRSLSGETYLPPLPVKNSSFTSFKSKKRPGTADSEEKLLPKAEVKDDRKGYNTFPSASGPSQTRRARGASLVYTHYQHSLNSLNDILDRDDKASLAELHQFLNSPDTADLIDLGLDQEPHHDAENEYAKELERFHASTDKGKQPADNKRASLTSSLRSERRRSLPTPVTGSGASFMSMDSSIDYHYHPRSRDRAESILGRDDATIRNADDQDLDFQMRRKKAAKLTQFFGVNYRDLIRDVLDSIESGLEMETKKGTVSKEEAEHSFISFSRPSDSRMSEDDRAAKAARAKAMLKKRQAAKKTVTGAVASGVASPASERSFSPAPPEPPAPAAAPAQQPQEELEEEKPKDISDVFGKDEAAPGDTSWLSTLSRALSPPPARSPVSPPQSQPPTQAPTVASPPPSANGYVNDGKLEELRLENESLKARLGDLDELRSRNSSLEKERDAAREKAEGLSKRVNALETASKQSEASASRLEAELDEVKADLRETQDSLAKEQRQSQELSERVEQIRTEKDNAIRNEQQTINLLVSEKAALTAELERLGDVDAQAQEVESELTSEQEKVQNLERQLEELRIEVRDTSTRNQALQAREKEMSEKTREQERQLQLANGSISSLRKEAESHQRRVKELEEQIESDDRAEKLEASLKNTQDRADELEFQLSKLKQAHSDVKAERDDLESRLTTHREGEGEWKSKHTSLEQQHQSIQQQLATVTSEKESLLSERVSLQSEFEQAQEAVVSLQDKLKQAAEELATSTRHLKAAQTEAKNAVRRADEAERTQRDLQTEGTTLMRSLDEMRPKIVELTGVKLELTEKVEGLERAVSSRDQVIAQLEGSLEETRQEKEMLDNQWQVAQSERERERTNAEDDSNELQKGYDKLQEELDSALASVRSLESDRTKNHQEASQRMKEVERLTALTTSQSEELGALRQELDQRSSEQVEGEGFIERAQNEIEALRQELSSKDEEIQRLKESTASTPKQDSKGPRSLDDEMLGSYKQQHDLELSAAQSQIRSLETALFDAEARSHTFMKQVAALEDQLASHVQHRGSPGVPSRPSSRHSNDLHRAAVTSSSRLNPARLAPPAYDQSLSPETRHKRKVSLSMLKARIDREIAATSRSLSPVPSIHGSNDGLQRSRPSSAMGPKAHALHQHTRPQFLDDSHVFWCGSCRGDLVIL
ncbi:hypothetical protein PQX77_003790 [Marasmius sp. AFHP31]|nr:hypothetical protein PQX77_003790 [Marasmius sp. AFHP31]